jgi:hypothetical protein
MTEQRINRDAYYVIHVTMPSGFEFKIPARGYNLKSWLNFEAKLEAECYFEETSRTVYEHLVMGDPANPLFEKDTPTEAVPEVKKASKTVATPKRKPAVKKAPKTPVKVPVKKPKPKK